MDADTINRVVLRLASEILERNRGATDLVLVGIQRRGVPLAERIAAQIGVLTGVTPPVTVVDIGFYGDDLSLLAPEPIVRESPLPEAVNGAAVILVDDVLYTGRTVYAALHHLLANTRPRTVQLAVLVDRGHRELPIQADFVGRSVPTKTEEIVKVMLDRFDGLEKVSIVERVEPAEGVK